MNKIYNWEENKLTFQDKYNNKYILEFRGNKTIIKGSSGVGKTFLCDKLSNIKNIMDSSSKYDANNIFIVNNQNFNQIRELKHQLIIVDNADLIFINERFNSIIDFINTDDTNRYLIFARVPVGIELSPNHYADLVTDEHNITKLKYRFSVRLA